MSRKHEKVAPMIEAFKGRELDPYYLAYFDCFNRQLYFEAHEVLERIWLPERGGPDGRFYKALIQLAGAFVHLQKQRWQPAVALFRLAQANLRCYTSKYRRLDLDKIHCLIELWLARLAERMEGAPVQFASDPPRLSLEDQ